MWASSAQAGHMLGAPRRLQTRDYTVGWICALPIELAAAQEMLDEVHAPIPDHDDPIIYTLGRMHVHNVAIACLPAGSIGTQSAATVAARMRSRFTKIKFGLMVGIGGGVPSVELDIRLGDVVVSHPYQQHGGVVQYDFGKTIAKGHIRTGWLNAPPPVLLSAIVEQRARHFRRQSTLENHLSKFRRLESFTRESAGPDVLFNATYEHPGGPTCKYCSNVEKVQRPGRRGPGVTLHYGTIASGNQVMKDGVKRDEISKELGGVMCFEMEAAGLMNDFPCLVIRGICDYADSHKNKKWQPYAAATAAACAKEILTIVPALPGPTAAPMGQGSDNGQVRIEMKLDLLMQELQLGYRTPGQVAQDLMKDLVDDNVTEVDVEENKEFIDEWLKSTEADGWLDKSVPDQRSASDKRAEDQVHEGGQWHTPRENVPSPKRNQAHCEDASDEEDDEWSDRDNYLLSDTETEVAEEDRVPSEPQIPPKSRLVPDETRTNKPDKTQPRQGYFQPTEKTPLRRQRTKAWDRIEVDRDYPRQNYSRTPSPVPRRRHRNPHKPQDPYPSSNAPTRLRDDPYYPSYGSGQPYDQTRYGGPAYGHRQNEYGAQTYHGRYNDAHGTLPQAHLPPPPPMPNDIRYSNGFLDRNGHFVRYASDPTEALPQYHSQSRPQPNPDGYRAAEDPVDIPPNHPGRTFHFSNSDSTQGRGFNFSDPQSIFAEFLKAGGGDMGGGADDLDWGAFGKGKDSRTRPGEVTIVEKPLNVTLEEIFKGTTKKMKIKRKTYDQGTGKMSTQDRILEVPIKRGLKAGSKIKFSNVGDQDEGGSQDLHFILGEKPHPLFQRNGDDIHQAVKLSLLEALCGWSRTVTSIDGKQLVVGSAGLTSPTWKEAYPGLGMPKSKAPTERGDMVIGVTIEFPSGPLSQEQKKALKDAFGK